MKRFRSEFTHSYNTYSFGYCEYAAREDGDRLSDIYEHGFLPYSALPKQQATYYMARSARVPLASFTPSSENRRILKRFDGAFTTETTPLASFDHTDPAFQDFCLTYFSKRHGEHAMPANRLEYILTNNDHLTHITTYKKDDEVVAYVFEIQDDSIHHFWFSFYDLSYAYQSLGMWLMLDRAQSAQEQNMEHFYVGTVYGDKARYKTNFKNIEFWDGNTWIQDKALLKKLSKNDSHHTVDATDYWKQPQEKGAI